MEKQIVKINFLPLVNSSFKFVVFKKDTDKEFEEFSGEEKDDS